MTVVCVSYDCHMTTDSNYSISVQEFDNEGFLECIKDLVRVDKDWVPTPSDAVKQPSLYIRPTFIGTEVTLHYLKPDVNFCKLVLKCILRKKFADKTFMEGGNTAKFT